MNSIVLPDAIDGALVVHARPDAGVTREQFREFCRLNNDLRIERTADGELVIMPPTGGETGRRNAEIAVQLGAWAKENGEGFAFDSSTGFDLPNGATRAPDAAWVRRSRLRQLTARQKEGFVALCPDFVVELRSPSDDLADVEAKTREYMDNGSELGWLIDHETRSVRVYRRGEGVEHLERPRALSGDPVLAGFVLELGEIWEPQL